METTAGSDVSALLTERDFGTVRTLIAAYAGIKLSAHKRNMVYNRLLRRLRACRVAGFSEYLDLVQAEGSPEREAFVNALTTNLTAFFREPHHFDLLAARARARAAARGAPLRVWSNACSTGEEPWSIAMVLREAGCAGDILATDIDTEVLATAKAGVYRADRIETLPAERLKRHFLRGTGANDGLVSVRPELRPLVRFAQLNLQSPVWPAQERFDVIFCRNVVIYFDREFQRHLLGRMADLLVPGGLLVVGHSESFPAAHAGFRSCGRTAYERLPG
ncbi:protein-glutamate O-methyltransferase CheR [Ramlibacter terrae]|uniref:Chemotaxis protein methyltransferase n=1 Tax=Ramlibacter terrae TaxID=2732511 RepID=A0ABX6P8R8_9BURK|nr:protein-glutamate O-methyltransferase CheR [Ramlibacter terrae]